MTKCVLDASTAVEVLLKTEAGQQSLEVIANDIPCVPHLFDIEVVNVLRRFVRHEEISLARANEAVEDLTAWTLSRFEHRQMLAEIWRMRDNATAYDAAYAALAITLDLPLLSTDSPLAEAGLPNLRVLLVR